MLMVRQEARPLARARARGHGHGATVLAVLVVLAVVGALLGLAAEPVGPAAAVPWRWLLLGELGVLGAVMALVAALLPARRR
jgi:hypothetical protein